jgi:ubiquinone/menaquinone biosynthesis C-methylase UbiE
MDGEFSAAFWEEKYSMHGGGQHSELNPALVSEAGGLEPSTALDVGCGEGSTAIWLASRGWQVTALDIARTALDRARERARMTDVAGRIDWVHADVTTWQPTQDYFGLVCAFYVHTAEPLDQQVGRLAAVVAPGGTLLVVGHGPSDPNNATAPHARFTPEQVADVLNRNVWDVAVAETRDRTAGRDGDRRTLRDAVLRARKHL